MARGFGLRAKQQRLVQEMENHVQGLVQKSEHVRERAFLLSIMPELELTKWSTEPTLPAYPAEKFVEGAKRFREQFRDEGMGRFDEPLAPANPQTRIVKETEKWTAYDVVLDVSPEFFAWGILVVPKDLKPGERVNLWSKFPAPPEDVQKISVVVPHFGPMDDVPISR